jgi:site-specific DNA-methyltransferase (adenine-specific)
LQKLREDRPVVRYNARQQMSGYTMLRSLKDECAALAIFDPQYRAVLDKLKFGNEGSSKQKARAALPQMSDYDISLFVEQIQRVLKPSGHLLMWFDKFAIGSGHHLRYFKFANWMQIVDLICWSTFRFGMGRRSRSACEYLVIAQKAPIRAKGCWTDNSIRDVWNETSDRSLHPHAKPAALISRLIAATTKRGDLVVDPCAGSYVVLDVCLAIGREFVGCDIK